MFEIHFIETFKIGGLVGCVKYSLNLIREKVTWNRCKTFVLCQLLMPNLLSLTQDFSMIEENVPSYPKKKLFSTCVIMPVFWWELHFQSFFYIILTSIECQLCFKNFSYKLKRWKQKRFSYQWCHRIWGISNHTLFILHNLKTHWCAPIQNEFTDLTTASNCVGDWKNASFSSLALALKDVVKYFK